MPKRTDIHKILIIGSGPIVIGQACEFDYSGTQGCKALREEGYEVVLVNSNPATIMTDPEFGDRTYIEPLVPEIVTDILRRERPEAILPTLGGQTGLNLAMDLYRMGVLEELGIELIGANAEAIERAEDRSRFKQICLEQGLDVPRSAIAHTIAEAEQAVDQIGLPCIIRPSFTLGGTGGGIAYNIEEFGEIARRGLSLSPVSEIMIEECVLGWKEFELEVMRDHADNFVVICSIENLDPMGVHTGDSITVAPAQTLTDKEYQAMRDDARTVICAIGVDCGGSNIQFAVDPRTGRRVVIEMNPRVSRSSALASKATGFPIARIAAKLAVGYRLDELPNDITRKTPACFEPTIDYVVTKIPRFAFEKFPGASPILGSQMKSVGETMAIGRNFRESLQKAMRSLETGRYGLGGDGRSTYRRPFLMSHLKSPNPERILYLKDAIKEGLTISEIADATGIDPWFIEQIRQIIDTENALKASKYLPFLFDKATTDEELGAFIESPESALVRNLLRKAKEDGFSDVQIAWLTGRHDPARVRAIRQRLGIKPVFKSVDTCAGEFEAHTPYYYSTYEQYNESVPGTRPKVIILGSGPNRIGQGIEFDYACVHAVLALRELGYEAIMVNNNPETVSTDYDISDKLYFEPLTLEDVLNIVELEQPEGVILQFGGQTPLKLARGLEAAGVRILGTSPESIDLAEDRERFAKLLQDLGIPSPPHAAGTSVDEVKRLASQIGLPVIVRPSYVLGGRGMEIVFEESQLAAFLARAGEISPDHPFYVDQFIEDAVEADVDALCDGERVVLGAIMEHIELAGIHSGDSACVIPPRTLSATALSRIRAYTESLAMALDVRGLINIQYAIKGDDVWVLEANPRASRTVPYVSKSTGVPLAKIAAKVMAGRSLAELQFTQEPVPLYYSVKEVVLPFDKFHGCEILLGPEMRSTGEVMGVSPDFGIAFAKAQMAASNRLPTEGAIFISVGDRDKPQILPVAHRFAEMGFKIYATPGTRDFLAGHGVPAEMISKISEGRPNVRDLAINNQIQLVINTPQGFVAEKDERIIRSTAIQRKITLITTIAAARAAANGIEALRKEKIGVIALQDYHSSMGARA